MPKIKAKVINTKVSEGKLLALIQCNRTMPKEGEVVTLKWGAVRSQSQNRLYWLYLEWVLEHGGLKDEYLSTEELHETLKGRFLAKRVKTNFGFDTVVIGSTTELDKVAFGEYMDKVDKAIVAYCGIDTSFFWEEYRDMYSPH